jgi:hypothetical protein
LDRLSLPYALIENGTAEHMSEMAAFRTSGPWLNCCLHGDAYPDGLNAGFRSVCRLLVSRLLFSKQPLFEAAGAPSVPGGLAVY